MTAAVRIIKRIMDVIAGALGLLVVSPLLPLIALAIRLDSPGPILYRQRRAGTLVGAVRVDGQLRFLFAEFDMPKFRTMRPDAEVATGPVLARRGDPRITRVGNFLRRSRLDELPQLWCVLCGQMSLVGPRPERPELMSELALAIPYFEERMRGVKPGITGLAQVNLGYDGAAPEGSEIARLQTTLVNPFRLSETVGAAADGMRLKLLYDLAYAASLNRLGAFLRLEAMILLRTPFTMLTGAGS